MIRALDILLSIVFLMLAAIPMLIIAIAIFLEDGLPVIFRQTRAGLGGRPFTILEFRSMQSREHQSRTGAVAGESWQDKEHARAQFRTTAANDARITSVGRFIRRTHLDELPQLLNVLQGNMSLVGVRPDTPAQEVDYTPEFWRERHTFKPGVTGLAQVMHKSTESLEGRTYWETVWIKRRSTHLYLKILFKTMLKVLRADSF